MKLAQFAQELSDDSRGWLRDIGGDRVRGFLQYEDCPRRLRATNEIAAQLFLELNRFTPMIPEWFSQ